MVHLIQMSQTFKIIYHILTSLSHVKMIIVRQNIKYVTMLSDTCVPASSMQQDQFPGADFYASALRRGHTVFSLLIALLQGQTFKFTKQHTSADIN